MSLKIITLNCFYDLFSFHNIPRLDTAINEIIKLNPDIVCLQEIISKGQINIVKNKLTSSGYHIFNEEESYHYNNWVIDVTGNPPDYLNSPEFYKF